MNGLSFLEVCENIKDGETYVIVNKLYRLKKIICKGGILEFESSDMPIMVGRKERYIKELK